MGLEKQATELRLYKVRMESSWRQLGHLQGDSWFLIIASCREWMEGEEADYLNMGVQGEKRIWDTQDITAGWSERDVIHKNREPGKGD